MKFSSVIENFVGIDLINTVDPNIFSFCFLVKRPCVRILVMEVIGRFILRNGLVPKIKLIFTLKFLYWIHLFDRKTNNLLLW